MIRHGVVLQGEVHDAPIARAHWVQSDDLAAVLGPLGHALRQVFQRVAPFFAVLLAVDRYAGVLVVLPRHDTVDEVLERVERLTAPSDQDAARLSADVQDDEVVVATDIHGNRKAHSRNQILEQIAGVGQGGFAEGRGGLGAWWGSCRSRRLLRRLRRGRFLPVLSPLFRSNRLSCGYNAGRRARLGAPASLLDRIERTSQARSHACLLSADAEEAACRICEDLDLHLGALGAQSPEGIVDGLVDAAPFRLHVVHVRPSITSRCG